MINIPAGIFKSYDITEPLVRLNVEVVDLETAESRKEELVKLIEKYGKF